MDFHYGIDATLGWDPDRWRWVKSYYFLKYITKFGRDLVIHMLPTMT